MPKKRQFSGDESVVTLSNWNKDQKTAERLAGSILHIDGFFDIDPSHPMGGPDGLKDLLCKKGKKSFIVGVYFPRSQQTFAKLLTKVKQDFLGVSKNNVDGLVFVTNQRLTIGEREKLTKVCNNNTEIYHLEKICSILNVPIGYGVRLEFLDIELSKDEQLSYFALKDKDFKIIHNTLSELLGLLKDRTDINSISNDRLDEYKNTLESIVGDRNSLFTYGNSMIDKLRVPVAELKEFQQLLYKIVGNSFGGILLGNGVMTPLQQLQVPINDLKKFKELLHEIVGVANGVDLYLPPINKLSVPLAELDRYNVTLDITIEKLREIQRLNISTENK